MSRLFLPLNLPRRHPTWMLDALGELPSNLNGKGYCNVALVPVRSLHSCSHSFVLPIRT